MSVWTPRAACRALLRRFGPRGWWPVTPAGAATPRYHPGRYGAPGPQGALEICVGAILTQNTAWTNVVRALERLHGARALTLDRLRALPRRRMEALVRSSGYFAQKTLKLKAFAKHAAGRGRPWHRWLREEPLARLRADLLSIHGVGPETADSMALYAGGRPIFVIDAYTRRIGGRLGWFDPGARYDELRLFFEARLPRSPRLYQEFHALLVELAKRHCRTRPSCAGCPLRVRCPAGRST